MITTTITRIKLEVSDREALVATHKHWVQQVQSKARSLSLYATQDSKQFHDYDLAHSNLLRVRSLIHERFISHDEADDFGRRWNEARGADIAFELSTNEWPHEVNPFTYEDDKPFEEDV